MFEIKIALSILLLAGTFSAMTYSILLFIKFLKKRLNKREVIKRTFWIAFCGTMSLFITFLIWQGNMDLKNLVFFLAIFVVISLVTAVSAVAPLWRFKD